jgi:hypothetical protein
MAKEKFESLFLAGGALLQIAGSTRLRRAPATPREKVGAAVLDVQSALDEHHDRLADPDAARRQVLAIREELCASKPSPLLIAGYATVLADEVAGVPEVVAPVRRLRTMLKRFAG